MVQIEEEDEELLNENEESDGYSEMNEVYGDNEDSIPAGAEVVAVGENAGASVNNAAYGDMPALIPPDISTEVSFDFHTSLFECSFFSSEILQISKCWRSVRGLSGRVRFQGFGSVRVSSFGAFS